MAIATEQYTQNVTNNVVIMSEDRARELQERLKRLRAADETKLA